VFEKEDEAGNVIQLAGAAEGKPHLTPAVIVVIPSVNYEGGELEIELTEGDLDELSDALEDVT